MNTISLVDRLARKNHARAVGTSQLDDQEETSRVSADILSAIASNNLPGLRVQVRFISAGPRPPQQLVAELNRGARGTALTFYWLAATDTEAGRLFIRDAAVGLLISESRRVSAKAWCLHLEGGASYQEIDPRSALSKFSRLVAREQGRCKNKIPAGMLLRVL